MTPPDLGHLRVLATVRIAWGLCWFNVLASRVPAPTFDGPVASLWEPLAVARWFETPCSFGFTGFVHVVAVVATALVTLGWFTRAVSPACFASSILFMCLSMSWGKVGHSTQPMLLVLLVFSMSDWGACWSIDRWLAKRGGIRTNAAPTSWAEWPLWLATFSLALLYVSSGLQKIIHGHFLESGFARYMLFRRIMWQASTPVPSWADAAIGWIIDHPLAIDALALSSVAFEVGFFIALISPRLRMLFLCGMFAFHGAIGALSGVYFDRPMLIGGLLLLPTAVLQLRAKSPVLATLFPRHSVDVSPKPTAPAWVRSTVTIAATLLLLLISERWIPETFPRHAGNTLAGWLTPTTSVAMIPRSPSVFVAMGVLGGILSLATLWWLLSDSEPVGE